MIDQSGDIRAVIIGVGGFLGVGEKNVAVDFGELQMAIAEDNTERWVLETTQEALNAAPAFEFVEDSPPTPRAGRQRSHDRDGARRQRHGSGRHGSDDRRRQLTPAGTGRQRPATPRRWHSPPMTPVDRTTHDHRRRRRRSPPKS